MRAVCWAMLGSGAAGCAAVDVPAEPSSLTAPLGAVGSARVDVFELRTRPWREGTDLQVEVELVGECGDGAVATIADALRPSWVSADGDLRRETIAARVDGGPLSFAIRTQVDGDASACGPLGLELRGGATFHEEVGAPTTEVVWLSAGAVPVDD